MSERRLRICPSCEATCGLALEVRGREVLSVTGDEADVYFIRSNDRGMTWQQPVKVTRPPFDGGHQWAPWIDVKPTGVIDVAYYNGAPVDPGGVGGRLRLVGRSRVIETA